MLCTVLHNYEFPYLTVIVDSVNPRKLNSDTLSIMVPSIIR